MDKIDFIPFTNQLINLINQSTYQQTYMEIIRKRAYARAGLLGNPSDGYNGKTISIIVRNFWAEVVMYEWDSVDIVQSRDDRARFQSVRDLAQDVRLHGYYGGIRLIKATIKRFVDYCSEHRLKLHDRNFSVRYETNIPRQVGLAGSSSIIVATLRCLTEFYGIEIPIEIQPSFVLSIETEELGISAGLQDRVIQCYQGVVYMDFDKLAERRANGIIYYGYERLDPALLPPLYIAYHNALSEPTETFHNDIRGRYDCGEPLVVDAMQHFAGLTVQGRDALLNQDTDQLARLIDENFDTRCNIYKLPDWQVRMVETARQCGASAKFAGSGGAVIGIYRDEAMFDEISRRMATIGSLTIRPIVTE
jgi:glucuronokinase